METARHPFGLGTCGKKKATGRRQTREGPQDEQDLGEHCKFTGGVIDRTVHRGWGGVKN